MTLAWPLNVPVLTDGVVTLRAHTPQDVDGMLEMALDPDMVRWTAIPTPHTREMSKEFALSIIPQGWNDGAQRVWAIEADGRYAGNVDVRGMPIADIGFALHPSARGRGLMVRAVRLATDWAFTHGGVEVVHWRSHVGNVASLRVAHATGFTLQGLSRGLLHERGQVLDAWTAYRRFGDSPLPARPWIESPVLESDGVRLRPLQDRDVAAIVEACSDPQAQHWLHDMPSPYLEEDGRLYLAQCAWRAAKGDQASWAIADPDGDDLLGHVVVMAVRNGHTGVVGYWMHPDARGRGMTKQALRLVVDHAFDPAGLGLARLKLQAAAGNAASNAVAVATGFRLFGTETAAELLGDGTRDDLNGYELLR